MPPKGILAIALFVLAGGLVGCGPRLVPEDVARRKSDHVIAGVTAVGALAKLVATIGRYFLITRVACGMR